MRKWTLKETKKFNKLHSKGLSPKEIALKLNRTHDSVLKKSDKLDLSFLKSDLKPRTRFNNFVIVNKTKRTIKGTSISYICLCDCGEKFELGRNSILTGNSISCGCIKKSNRIKPEGQSAKNKLFNTCKNNALRRDLEFNLNKEEHFGIISQNCHHCGKNPSPYNPYLKKDGTVSAKEIVNYGMIERAWILINTVDRIDNSRGYSIDNCVPSCWPCNKMRVDLSIEDFISQAYKIVAFQEEIKRKSK